MAIAPATNGKELQARGISDEHADPATARLLEIWMDDAGKQIWYVFA